MTDILISTFTKDLSNASNVSGTTGTGSTTDVFLTDNSNGLAVSTSGAGDIDGQHTDFSSRTDYSKIILRFPVRFTHQRTNRHTIGGKLQFSGGIELRCGVAVKGIGSSDRIIVEVDDVETLTQPSVGVTSGYNQWSKVELNWLSESVCQLTYYSIFNNASYNPAYDTAPDINDGAWNQEYQANITQAKGKQYTLHSWAEWAEDFDTTMVQSFIIVNEYIVAPTITGVSDYESFSFQVGLNQLASGNFVLNDAGLANKATHISNLLTTASVADVQGTTRFKGEVRAVQLSRDKAIYQLRDYKQKLNRTRATTTTIGTSGKIRGLFPGSVISSVGFFLSDEDKAVTNDQYNAYILTLEDVDGFYQRNPPVAYAFNRLLAGGAGGPWVETYTPDQQSIGVDEIYFNDSSITIADNRLSARFNSVPANEGIELTFQVHVDAFASIDRLTFNAVFRFRSNSGVNDYPQFHWYDYTNTRYITTQLTDNRILLMAKDDVDVQDAGDDQFSLNETGDVNVSIELDLTASDFFSISSTNGHDVVEFKIHAMLSQNTFKDNTFHYLLAYYEAWFNTEQTPGRSTYYVNDTATGVSPNNRIECELSQSWESGEPTALQSGFGYGDKYYITKNLSALLTDMFTDSGATLTLSQNITNAETLGVITEYSGRYLSDYINYLLQLFNAYDWVDYGTNTYTIVTADNFTDSGITLTEADIVNYDNGAFVHIVNADNIVGNIYVNGKYISENYAIPPVVGEPTHTLGAETFIVDNPELISQSEVDRAQLDNAAKKDTADRSVRFTINLTNAPQSYTALKIGTEVGVKVPNADGSLMNYVSGGDGRLVVWAYKYYRDESTGNQEYLDLDLRRIYT